MKARSLGAGLIGLLPAGLALCAQADAGTPRGTRGGTTKAIAARLTCSQPAPADADACRRMEAHILSATVRLRIETWVVKPDESGYLVNSAIGHATVKDGRCLVTHNHFGLPLSLRPRAGEPEAYGLVTIYTTAGERLTREPLSDFEVVWDDPQTLVIAHQAEGFFEELGFVSAEFNNGTDPPLEPGMEVAQVDWDGVTTRVDWAAVQAVNVEGATAWLVLADDTLLGASGGGVFWQGAHIANNWLRVPRRDASGAESGVSRAAMNSARVAAAGCQGPARQ